MNSQFSLSIELTRLLPIAPLAELGGRAFAKLARDLQRTGSDITTEEDLAVLLGRCRIDEQFASSFRTAARISTSQPLSQFINIMLESGCGPTVQRCLGNPAYFSMVVQLSLLVYCSDIRSLASGLSAVFIQRAETVPSQQKMQPRYESILGTLRVISEETSHFNWDAIFQAVPKLLGISGPPALDPPRRVIPHAILRGCMEAFPLIQQLPEHRLVQIRISEHQKELLQLLVIWAHVLLRLTVSVVDEAGNSLRKFGSGQDAVVISVGDEWGLSDRGQVCVLNESGDELFKIVPSDESLDIEAYSTAPLLGFAYREVQKLGGTLERSRASIVWLCHSLFGSHLRDNQRYGRAVEDALQLAFARTPAELAQNGAKVPAWTNHKCAKLMLSNQDRDRILMLRSPQINIARAIVAIAHIEDLSEIADLPISLDAMRREHPSDEDDQMYKVVCSLIEPDALHGKGSLLVSNRGWSVYKPIVALPDPCAISAKTIRVVRGVPARNGEKKRYVIDGIAVKSGIIPCVAYEPALEVPFLKPSWMVGLAESAFTILVDLTYREGPNYVSCRTSLNILDAAARSAVCLEPCPHRKTVSNPSINLPPDCYQAYIFKTPLTGPIFPLVPPAIPSVSSAFGQPVAPPYIGIVTTAGYRTARWLAIKNSAPRRTVNTVLLMPEDCCITCAVLEARTRSTLSIGNQRHLPRVTRQQMNSASVEWRAPTRIIF